MSNLGNFLASQIMLGESDNTIKRTIVIYSGRFQPMHKGHYGVYEHLVKKFGKDNVFIGTSDKVDPARSPLNFKEKKQIMTTMFPIPKNKVVQVKSPYNPKEILDKFDENTTSFVAVVSEKDKSRLGGKYFLPWEGNAEYGYKEHGYVYVTPMFGKGISASVVRDTLSNAPDDEAKKFFKTQVYNKFNQKVFDLIKSKLSESIIIEKETIENWLLKEATIGGVGQDDDGPNGFFPNMAVFDRVSIDRAHKIGYDVVKMIMTKDLEDYYEHPEYPDGPTKAVSFYPAGVIGKMTPNNQVDVYSSGAYSQWYKHVTRKASMVGYELVQTQLEKSMAKKLKQLSVDMAIADKDIEAEFEHLLDESITLPVEIGDTLLMGKWKNKPVVVKTIGKDEHGMPTINGKKVVTFRFGKKGPNIFDGIVELEELTKKGKHFKNLGVPRSQMPQIEANDVPDYVDFLKQVGVSSKKVAMPISKLELTQKDIDTDKVEQLKDAPITILSKPIIVSKDNYVLDGHHRILAFYFIDNNAKIPAIKVDLPMKALLKVSKEYDKVSFKKIDELVVESKLPNDVKVGMVVIDGDRDKFKIIKIQKDKIFLKPITFKGEITIFPDDFGKDADSESVWDYLDLNEMVSLTEATNKLKLNIPKGVRDIHKAFKKNGKKLYVVGGAVRDAILGQKPKDFDLATDAKPDEVLAIAKKEGFHTAEVGKSFGVVIVNGDEIATFRKDIGKGRRPDAVDYTDIYGDVKRRDLTINALFYDLDKEEIVDLVGGIADLKKKNIRTVGNAEDRFGEDELRKLRAFRFHARIGGKMDKDTELALKNNVSLNGVSGERIRDEFLKSIKSAKSVKDYFKIVDDLGYLKLILPNLSITKPFIEEKDYKVLLAYLLQGNDGVEKKLNKLKYSQEEARDIEFLIKLKDFQPEDIRLIKSKQNSQIHLSDDQIKNFGKLVGKNLDKYIKFKLTVKGTDIPPQLKGKEISDFMNKEETKLFLNEALATKGNTIHKFITGKNLTVDGKKYGEIEFEVVGTDNGKKLVKLRVLSPKNLFGREMNVPFKTIKRGPFLKTDTGNAFNEMARKDLVQVDKYADKQLSPTDVAFTNHFFDRINDPRNGKEITVSELVGFFKRLSRHKSELKDFLTKYKEFTITDKRTDINIPLVKQANKIIAKTVMRKHDWKSHDPVLTFENKLQTEDVNFRTDIVQKPRQWYQIDNKDMVKISSDVIDLVRTAYKTTKDGSFVNSPSDIKRSVYWSAIDLDGMKDADAVVFGRKSPFGIKIQGIGHDGDPISKKEVINHTANILKQNGFWVEVSDVMEHILYKMGVPYISSEKVAQSMFPNSDLKMTGKKGQYTRKLESGKVITETIFGKPNVKVSEHAYDKSMDNGQDERLYVKHWESVSDGSGHEDSIDTVLEDINIALDSMIKPKKVISEGGAATGGSPIPGEVTMDMYNDVVKQLSSIFKLTQNDFKPLGSTGKKGKGQYSGDIDIAIDAVKIGGMNKLRFDEVSDYIYSKIKGKFDNVVNSKGLGVISFLYPIPNTQDFGQIDIMLSSDLEMSSFMYHSPDFTKRESNYKGMYRNLMLFAVLSEMDAGDVKEYFEDGSTKTYPKFSLTAQKGLFKQLKTFQGKVGKLKNAKPVKNSDSVVSQVPKDIIKIILGDEYVVEDANSFESIYKIVTSSKFKHKDKTNAIIKNFKQSVERLKVPLPTEIK